MSRKHNTKHSSRGASNYPKKLEGASPTMSNPVLSDGRRASDVKR